MRTRGQPVPEVSIILTSFNSQAYLGRTLRSVCDQSFVDWELLAVDDGSTDGSRSIITALADSDPRVRPIFREVNSGLPAVARNDALDLARGNWVAVLDSDDLWHPQKLERQLQALSTYDADFCSTRSITFTQDEEVGPWWTPPRSALEPDRVDHRRLLLGNSMRTSSVILRREFLEPERFNVDPRYFGVEDYDCWLRIHRDRVSTSIQLREPLTCYRYAPGSVSSGKLRMARRRLSLYSDHLKGSRLLRLKLLVYSVTSVLVGFLRRRNEARDAGLTRMTR